MKRDHIPFIAFFLALIAMYLCFAFVLWEMNPAVWSISARSALAVFGVPAAIATMFAVGAGLQEH